MYYKTGIFVTIYLGILTNVAGVTPIKIQIHRGQTATLMCNFQEKDAPANTLNIRWNSAKQGLLTSGMIVYKHQNNLEVQKPTQHDWNLIIKKVDDAFAGDYTCATNTGMVIARYTLEIVDGPRIIQDRSSASVEEFQEGSTPELKCHFSGVPTPTVRWYRGLRDAVADGITGEILRFPDVTRYASDTYICEGKNSVGSLNYTIDLQVNFPVEVDVMAEVINASRVEVVTLEIVENPENDRFAASQTGLASQAVAEKEEVVSKPMKKKKKTSVESCQCSAELLDIQRKLLAEAESSNALNKERNIFLEKISSSLAVLATKQ